MLSLNDDGSISAKCFRCGEKQFVKAPELSAAAKIKKLTAMDEADNVIKRTSALPEPAEHDTANWPSEAKLWLYKAGLSNADITNLGIYYHPPTGRVVLPVIKEFTPSVPVAEREVTYWQARSVNGSKAKYINATHVDRSSIVATFGSLGDAKWIVLTEDYLSAYRTYRAMNVTTGQSSYRIDGTEEVPSVSQLKQVAVLGLLGTSLMTPILRTLLFLSIPVLIFLDADHAGVSAAQKIQKQLTAFGLSVVIIDSHDRDPKLYSDEELRRLITWHSTRIRSNV